VAYRSVHTPAKKRAKSGRGFCVLEHLVVWVLASTVMQFCTCKLIFLESVSKPGIVNNVERVVARRLRERTA
jgi:hypothetical protein